MITNEESLMMCSARFTVRFEWICGVEVEEMLGKFITWTFSLFSRLELSWDEVDKIIMVLFWFKFKFKTKTMKK